MRLPPPGNAQSVRDLVTINADLGRLGDLLKRATDEGTNLGFEGADGSDCENAKAAAIEDQGSE